MEDEKEINKKDNNEKLKVLTIISDLFTNNSKSNKISISKENYEIILNYINNPEDEELISLFDYLNDINCPILIVLIDGYIENDFEDENKNKLILEKIAKLIKIYFNKNIFYCVYRYLSKMFRKHILLKDIKTIKKFEKIFNVWKSLYNIDNNSINKKNYERIENKHFEINIKNKELSGENSFIIDLYFNCSEFLNKLKLKEDFYFLKIYDDKKGKISLAYKNIFDLNTAELIGKTNRLVCNFSKNGLNLVFNNNILKSTEVKEKNFNFNNISKIKINNYFFFADIFQINIQIKSITTEEKSFFLTKILDIQIKKENFEKKYTYDLNLKTEDEKDIKNVKSKSFNYISFNEIKFQKNRGWLSRKKRLGSIKYYGGIESFIPLFKIIKYIIDYLGNIENKEQKEILDYLNKCIIWIKDIMRIILRLICINEKNYANFKNVVVPLIGSFAEILHILNKLISSGSIPADIKKNLSNDEIIYTFFIAIVYLRPNKNIIEMYKRIFEMEEKWNINFTLEYFLFDIGNIKDSHFYWYFSVLFSYALFIVIYNDSLEHAPKSIVEHIDKILLSKNNTKSETISNFLLSAIPFVNLLKVIYSDIKDANYNIQYSSSFLKTNNYYLKILINLMKTVLNAKYLSKINKINYSSGCGFIIKILFLLNENKIKFSKKDTEYNEVLESFYNYLDDAAQLEDWLGIKSEKLMSARDVLINELVDYHGEYHNTIKKLFLFNGLWSKEKLFFNIFAKDNLRLKYKNINYYTRNFQRPILFPILDYKYRYPEFSSYKMQENFYMNVKKENKDEIIPQNEIGKIEDDYNFNLDCPEFDKLIKNNNIDIYEQIKFETKDYIEIFDVCLVKQNYHVKGNLFLLCRKQRFRIIFFSYLYDFENKKEKLSKCNKLNLDITKTNFKYENNTKDLCFGQIFKCPEKEKNRKIEIDMKNIRMILKKIYFYRKSGVEIFTETKSYYFNFFSNEQFEKFIIKIEEYFENSDLQLKNEKEKIFYFPINISQNKKIGYIKTNKKISKTDFIDFIMSNCDTNDISIFDIIIFMNLIANRSYLDLNQYPIFPVLFFYDNTNKILERDFTQHIGFQTKTIEGKKRCEISKENYNDNKKKIENEEEEENEEKHLYYFNTHYSNIVYTCNYLVRLFPYSFCAIELQGKYFDDPNRLFFSIEKTLISISGQISDLRELIPEFFYMPEMFININNLNFLSLKNGTSVDDVIIPNNYSIEKYITNESMYNIINGNNNNLDFNEESKRKNILKIFLFVMEMRIRLESLKENLRDWLFLIFGKSQKFLKKKKGQLFRSESYIDVNEDTFKKYSSDDIIMKSVEFGLIPLQIISDSKSINSIKNRKYMYDKTIKNQKLLNNFEMIDNKDFTIFPNFAEYWDNNPAIHFKIRNGYGSGKLKIFNNNILVNEIIDHSDKIISIFYNQRLNMFATCSYDGLACVYIFPHKLFCVLKHPKNLYFDRVFLSANPYPTIITYEIRKNTFTSYSLSGFLINRVQYDKGKINIILHFDIYGGTYKDRIEIELRKVKGKKILLDLPFFDEVK